MSRPPSPWREDVRPEWIDYNAHLSEPFYVLVLGHATDAVMARIGMTPQHLTRTGTSLFTVEAHIRYLEQVEQGCTMEVSSSIIGAGPSSLWIWHEMWVDGSLRATEEVLALHVSTVPAVRTTPFPDDIATCIAGLCVDPPAQSGRRIVVR